MGSPFLTARWEYLVLLNFECPPRLLEALVPIGTELDTWEGKHLVSLVGFMFRDTRVAGCRIPGHHTFEEVNLRFYVRRVLCDEVRRGVVFVRELVPRRAIAAIARAAYNEPYLAVPMSHSLAGSPETGAVVEYTWRHRGSRHGLRAEASGPASELAAGSEAEFITEHYWGYNRQRSGATLEYRVDHPRWLVWDCSDAEYMGDAVALYGPEFGEVLAEQPVSSHLAVGSEVSVFKGRPLGTV